MPQNTNIFNRVIPKWVLGVLLLILVALVVGFIQYMNSRVQNSYEVVATDTEVLKPSDEELEQQRIEEAQRQLEALDEATKDMPRPTLEESQRQLEALDAETKDIPRPTEEELRAQLEALDAQTKIQ